MKSSRQGGFALLSVMIAAAVMGVIAVYRTWHTMKLLRQRSDFAHAQHAKYLAREQSLNAARSNLPMSSSALLCHERAAQNADVSISRRVCSRINLGAEILTTQATVDGSALTKRERFPQFDYNRLLEKRKRCSISFVRSTESTPSGFRLTPLSAISKYMCYGQTASASADSAYDGNVALSEELLVSAQTAALAATGYLDLPAGIIVEGDLTIVAGGDVHIKRISTTSALARVSVLSATGVVMIEELSGAIELRATGWQGVFIPAQAFLTTHEVLPAQLPEQILSLTAASRQ